MQVNPLRGRGGVFSTLLILTTILLGFESEAQVSQWSQQALSTQSPPNILLLMAEDMGPRVGAFGDPVAVTPNIDALAERGTRYTAAFTASGVCAPSRAALLTGMHPISIGAQHMRTSSSPDGEYLSVPPHYVKAFPELLRAAGYYTFTDGKLDYQFSGALSGSGPSSIWNIEEGDAYWEGRSEKSQPFFGLINLMETHESGVFTQLFEAWPHSFMHFLMQGVRAFLFDIPIDGGTVQAEEVVVPPYYPDTKTVRSDLARHYKNIQFMDARVGEILTRLRADGLAESTIVIWTTDHGDGLPRGKRDLYDSGIKVPLVIYWPDRFRPGWLAAGEIDERLISFVDLAPTLLQLAGLQVPPHFQGKSFVENDPKFRDYVFASRDRIDDVDDRERAVRDQRYKYIRSWYPNRANGHPSDFRDNLEIMRELWEMLGRDELNPAQQIWFQPTGAERLYDLRTDPYELKNLASDPLHASTLERMRGAYAEWRRRVPDWSDEPEHEMMERMWPSRKKPRTEAPQFSYKGNQILMISPTVGASIVYRVGEGHWQVYREPVQVEEGDILRARAVRYGYAESEEVERILR